MKLIIDIPEEDRKDIGNIHFVREDLKFKIGKAIMNGTPLDDVKSEIDKAQEPYQTSTAYDEGVRFGLMLAYQIVDKCKAESEGT